MTLRWAADKQQGAPGLVPCPSEYKKERALLPVLLPNLTEDVPVAKANLGLGREGNSGKHIPAQRN